ncbi:His-Xaa-Ser repeat protein HxsA [Halopseudomonas pelagia]|uniref:His-Xaa-Ser repeat protein HxsA n=1 Tax=Halopseudomonas pelagia TaxID=553151 RepID=UPI000A054C2C
MSKFTKSLSVFMASIGLVSPKSQALHQPSESTLLDTYDPINLRPLNMDADNLYAAHRSHSSHSSHRSSSGSYSSPSRSSPVPNRSQSSPSRGLYNSSAGTSQPVDPGRPATVTPSSKDIDPANAKLVELIKRVQMGLYIKGYDPGSVDGIMGERTRVALRKFQSDYGLPADGLMGTDTLSALGVVIP